jgi:hypothetical protein
MYSSRNNCAGNRGHVRYRHDDERIEKLPIDGAHKRTVWRTSGTYFVRRGDPGLIKIGRTVELLQRLQTLQGQSDLPMVLLGFVSTWAHEVFPGYPERWQHTEMILHRRFAHIRAEGEWFYPEPDLLAFIAEHATPVDRPVRDLLHAVQAWKKVERARRRA